MQFAYLNGDLPSIKIPEYSVCSSIYFPMSEVLKRGKHSSQKAWGEIFRNGDVMMSWEISAL